MRFNENDLLSIELRAKANGALDLATALQLISAVSDLMDEAEQDKDYDRGYADGFTDGRAAGGDE